MTALTRLSDLELALALADAADAMTMERFRAPDLAVREKPDGSPVTDADMEVERELRQRLREARASHAVVGEETGASGHSSWCWYLDPIDGTPKFAAGAPEWHTLIGLAHEG